MKKVTIISTVGERNAAFETEATTWGEFKQEISRNYDRLGDMKVIIGGVNTELSLNEAQLPANNFFLFFSPAKSSSGWLNK